MPEGIRGWRYAEDGRDLRLDLLRGLAALAMIVDHVGGDGSWFYTLTGGDRFFVSGAEGFVFISGLVMGLVYARLIARRGLRAALAKGLRRVATLYLLTTVLALGFAAVSAWQRLPWAPDLAAADPGRFVRDILTLHRTFYLTDVLLLYTLAVAAALPALVVLRRGWGLAVLAASWALWLAWQWWPDRLDLPWPVAGSNTFHYAAWQVLFLTGLVLGYQRDRLGTRRRSLEGAVLLLAGAVAAAAIVVYTCVVAYGPASVPALPVVALFAKADLRAGRLALFACFFVAAWLLTTRAWQPIRRLLGGLLLPLGQHALLVYSLHLAVLAALAAIWPPLPATPAGAAANTLRQASAIAAIWLIVLARRSVQAWGTRLARGQATGAAPGAGTTRPLPRTVALGAGVVVVLLLVIAAAGAASGAALPAPLGAARPPDAGPAAPGSAGAVAGLGDRAAPDFRLLMSGTVVPSPGVPTATPFVPPYVESHTFHSTTLDRDLPYYVYLPPSYAATPDRRYPVLYMLHGGSASNVEWLDYGLATRAMDLMAGGQIAEFLVVLPQGDDGYWIDQAGGGPQWGTYVAHDLVAEVDARFRTLRDARHRAVGGVSMGGSGALTLALMHPELFGIVGADSPSLHGYENAPAFFGDLAYFQAHDPITLYHASAALARRLTIWLDVGQDDGWLAPVAYFHRVLQAARIPHQWHVYPGGHEAAYWQAHVPDYLQFYGDAFGRLGRAAP